MSSKNSDNSLRCLICNWPINAVLDEKTLNRFYKGILKWVSRKNASLANQISKKIRPLLNRSIAICRWDMVFLIKQKIREVDKILAKKFEREIEKNFDFKGSLIS